VTTKSKGSDILLLNLSLTVRSLRNNQHHFTNSGVKPKFVKICMSLS
jgi:hypothetical protein